MKLILSLAIGIFLLTIYSCIAISGRISREEENHENNGIPKKFR